jgi:dCTP deaminase
MHRGFPAVILTGREITAEVENGNIVIDPFDRANVNPNSYGYRLGNELVFAADGETDPARAEELRQVDLIPADGYVLRPGFVYLSSTAEKIGSERFVTSLIGRSSVGRLGLFVQVDADLGHVGAVHNWTLELVATQAVRVYTGMVIGQVTFWQTLGQASSYTGRYAVYDRPATCISSALFDAQERVSL